MRVLSGGKGGLVRPPVHAKVSPPLLCHDVARKAQLVVQAQYAIYSQYSSRVDGGRVAFTVVHFKALLVKGIHQSFSIKRGHR